MFGYRTGALTYGIWGKIKVESRTGAVRYPTVVARFPSPLIKPDVQNSRIRLSDRLHNAAHAESSLDAPYRMDTKCPEHDLLRKLAITTRWRTVMTTAEKIPNSVRDVAIH